MRTHPQRHSRTIFAVGIALLLMVSGSSWAQQAQTPLPTDPAQVFAPGVEVLSETLSAAARNEPSPTNPLSFDNEQRELHVTVEGETRIYPYPDAFAEITTAGFSQNGTEVRMKT